MVRANGGADAASKADPAHLDALAREALGRDPDAVRRFLLTIAPAIGRACRGVMGARHSDLEDTIQECFVDVTHGLPYYRFEGNLLGFVSKIAVRRDASATYSCWTICTMSCLWRTPTRERSNGWR